MERMIVSKQIVLYLLFFSMIVEVKGQIFMSNHAEVSFFSSAPLEDIKGISKQGLAALNLTTGEIIYNVQNNTFQFEKQLMKDHFNENYMESERYPISQFKGKIEDPGPLKQDGTYMVSVVGKLNVHGVIKDYRTPVKMTVEKGKIKATCSFQVRTADHNIKIPTIVIKNIAEVLDITVSADFTPKNN